MTSEWESKLLKLVVEINNTNSPKKHKTKIKCKRISRYDFSRTSCWFSSNIYTNSIISDVKHVKLFHFRESFVSLNIFFLTFFSNYPEIFYFSEKCFKKAKDSALFPKSKLIKLDCGAKNCVLFFTEQFCWIFFCAVKSMKCIFSSWKQLYWQSLLTKSWWKKTVSGFHIKSNIYKLSIIYLQDLKLHVTP